MKNKQIVFETGLILVSILYVLSVVSSTFAGASINRTAVIKEATVIELETRVQVRPQDLPEKVTKTLNDKSYAGWSIQDAYLVTADNGSQYYELLVRKADEQSRMKIDKNGQILN